MAKKEEAPPAPDYSPLIELATKQADRSNELAQEQFDWAKSVYAADKATSDKIVQAQLDVMDQQAGYAKEDRDRYNNTALPLRDQYIRQAQDYNTEARRESEAGAAQANVAAQYDQARDANMRELESYGINPSATRYGALDIAYRTGSAAAAAAAGNTARRQVEQTGRDMLTNAINMESGLPSQTQAELNGAVNAGSAASGTTLNQTSSGANTMGTAPQYMSGANSATGTAGALMSDQYNGQLNQYNANAHANDAIWEGLGSLAGTVAGMKMGGAFDPSPVRRANGGVIPTSASPSRGAIPDDVHAMISAGEFVIPEDVVRWKGQEFFQRLINKARAIPLPNETAGYSPARAALPVT